MDSLSVERLHKRHDLDSFSCGVEPLDTWLQKSARPTGGAGENRTYVWCDDGVVLGYFTLAPAVIVTNPMIDESAPGILLCKLAVHESMRGSGEPATYGQQLLQAAFGTVLKAADLIGGKFLAVDPINAKVASFYAQFGFEPLDPDSPDEDRQIIKISVLRKGAAQAAQSRATV